MAKKQNKLKVAISIDAAMLKAVDGQAHRLGVSRSEYISTAIQAMQDQSLDILALMSRPKLLEALVEAFSKPGVLADVLSTVKEPGLFPGMPPKGKGADGPH